MKPAQIGLALLLVAPLSATAQSAPEGAAPPEVRADSPAPAESDLWAAAEAAARKAEESLAALEHWLAQGRGSASGSSVREPGGGEGAQAPAQPPH